VSTRRLVGIGVVVSLLVAGVVSYLAVASPDGLQHVAAGLGFDTAARSSAADGSPLAGYEVRGVTGPLSGGLAGVLGLAAVALVMTLFVVYVRRRAARQRD
jgi:cobalt/nickel transport protein